MKRSEGTMEEQMRQDAMAEACPKCREGLTPGFRWCLGCGKVSYRCGCPPPVSKYAKKSLTRVS